MKEIELLADTGVDLRNKVLQLTGDVDDEMYTHLVTSLHMLNNYQGGEGYDAKPVTIMLSTYGGDLFYAFAIYDVIKEMGINTRIICNGPVMSAGSIILQASTRRLMMPNSTILVHFGSQTVDDTKTKHQYDQMLKKCVSILSLRATVKDATVKGWFKKESYFDANKALKDGLIDEVYNVKK